MRLRVPQKITSITLHHEGSARPLLPGDDPVQQLRALQAWGERDRNWWDVPYHYLIDLDGNIYEGRDWHYMGETNTTYDPSGHFLISIIGNYNLQEPTQKQLNASPSRTSRSSSAPPERSCRRTRSTGVALLESTDGSTGPAAPPVTVAAATESVCVATTVMERSWKVSVPPGGSLRRIASAGYPSGGCASHCACEMMAGCGTGWGVRTVAQPMATATPAAGR
jgi:hypothetical protein